MRPGDPHARVLGEVTQAAGGGMRSIRAPRLLSRIGPLARSAVARSMARPAAGGSGTRTTLVPLPHTRSTRMVVFFADVGDAGAGGFEDPQVQQPGPDHQGEVVIVVIGRRPDRSARFRAGRIWVACEVRRPPRHR